MSAEVSRDDAAAQPGCAYIRCDLAAAIEAYRALMTELAADRDRPGLARRVGRLNATLQELRASVDAHVWNDRLAAAFGDLPATPRPRPGRHARPGMVLPLRRRHAAGAGTGG